MSGMTAKDRMNPSLRESVAPTEPLSIVSICLDKETWGIVKLFADSSSIVQLSKHLDEYRVDDHDSVLGWIGSPQPDVCLLDFDKDRRAAAMIAAALSREIVSSPLTASAGVS